MRVRRLHKRPAALEVTAFINLIVVLVPFLLSTAVVFAPGRARSDAACPVERRRETEGRLAAGSRDPARWTERGDRIGGQIQWIANKESGYDYPALAQLMLELKAPFPKDRRVDPGRARHSL